MSKKTKIWLCVATSLVLVGGIIFAGVMTVLKWDFLKLDTSKFETNMHEITEDFEGITINTKTANIEFALTDGECKVVCYEQSKVKHSVSVENGTLTVNVNDQRKWYNYIGLNFKTPKITVYLSQGQYGALNIEDCSGDIKIAGGFGFQSIDIASKTGKVDVYASVTDTLKIDLTTGDTRVENLSAGKLQITTSTGDITVKSVNCVGDIKVNVSTGDIKLTDVNCGSITSSGSSTGDISLKNVIANGILSLKTSTGDIKLNGCDALELFMTTDTGDVEGSLLSEKVFIVKTDTGDVDVPKTVAGGRCEITTDTGDIEFTIK